MLVIVAGIGKLSVDAGEGCKGVSRRPSTLPDGRPLSQGDLVGALQPEHLTRIGGRRDLE